MTDTAELTHLEAITAYVELVRDGLPESFPGDGPVLQALGEIVAEATALDSFYASGIEGIRYELTNIKTACDWIAKRIEPQS